MLASIPRRVIIYSALSLVALAIIAFVGWWVFTSPYIIWETEAKDDIERLLESSITSNGTDFHCWYKTNIVMQLVAIFSGIGATVIASLTTNQNAYSMKYITIALTTTTALIIAIQSTFNIRENLATYIQINAALTNLQDEYISYRDGGNVAEPEFKKLQLETQKQITSIQQIRWRTYAKIGQSQLKIADPDTNAREQEFQKTKP